MSEIPETEEAMPTKINLHAFQANLCLHEFFEPILLFDPHGLKSMVRKEILAVFEGKQKGVISPKPERPRPSKLVCMHFTSTSTCMNFLSQFYFLTPMDYTMV